jgi:DNA polymerase (family 10)
VSSRRTLAGLLWQLADLTRASETRRSFRARAYRRAVWALDDLDPDLRVEPEQIVATPGIGAGIAALIEEFRQTGGLARVETLKEMYPQEVERLRRLPRMTPKRLRELKDDVGVETPEDLARAIDTGDALTLHGVGESTLALWATTLDLAPSPGAVPSHEAWVTAAQLGAHLQRHTDADVRVAGAVRRVDEWVDLIELLAATSSPERVDEFLETSAALRSWDQGDRRIVTHTGIDGTVHLSTPDSLGTDLIVATGPPAHVTELFGEAPSQTHATEAEAYQAHGLEWIPPPARAVPLDVAATTVRLADIRGDLHIHTERSPDGRLPLSAILDIAVARGYQYLLVTDHTLGLRFGGLGPDQLAAQSIEIEGLRPAYPGLTVFHGAEVNIDREGGLDLDGETLGMLDFVVAGMHSHFGLSETEQTDRMIRALSQPSVRVLAHPTGRRIGVRPAVSLDIAAVVDAAVAYDRALECNGHRDRLDLGAAWVGKALEKGARFAADSDAHRVDEFDNIANAVATLQAAGVGAGSVVNAMPIEEFTTWATGNG